MSHGPYYTFFSIHLEALGYSKTVTGMLWSLGVLAEVVLFLVMHRVMAGFSLRNIMLVSLTLSVLRWGLIGYFADNAVILFFAQLMHAATFGSSHAVAVELVTNGPPSIGATPVNATSGISVGLPARGNSLRNGW